VSYEKLTYELEDHIAAVTLDRPEVLNALDQELLAELAQVCERVNEDPAVRAVIITGAGRAFCAGGDIKSVRFADQGGNTQQRPEDHWAAKLLAIGKPTIAAVNGIAAGGGLSLALACDIRIASEKARFSAIFARIGMSVLDGAGWLLSRTVGQSRALEMLYTADKLDAAEALGIGLVSHVVPHEETLARARALAAKIAANPPVALQCSKQVVTESMDKNYLEHLPLQWAAMDRNLALARHDIEEGARAFAEKRDPRFRGLEGE
jgi:2-(1,2-epoxy-1,2-dihydrophenyl)acetyl-CoA isomerase